MADSVDRDMDIRTWLDTHVRKGWGAKFALAFENCGEDVVEDLLAAAPDELEEVRGELEQLGARKGHMRKIMGAVDALRSAHLDAHAGDAAAGGSSGGSGGNGKAFAAFLSHHKAGAAMEARHVKSRIEPMLGAGALPVFCACGRRCLQGQTLIVCGRNAVDL